MGGIFGRIINEGGNNKGDINFDSFVNSGAVKGSGDFVGGLIGYGLFNDSYSNYAVMLKVTNSKNTGAIEGNNYVGGLLGYGRSCSADSCIQDCENASSIKGAAYVGCIAGQLETIRVDSCKNDGSTLTATGYVLDSGNKYAYVGGYVGCGYTFSNCTNKVEINYTGGGMYVGGICGYVSRRGSYNMSKLENTANISGASYVGGIFGRIINEGGNNKGDINFDGFANSGTVKGSGDYIGGLIGHALFNDSYNNYKVMLTLINSSNTGTVRGANYAGGLFGYVKSNSNSSSITDCTATGAVNGESNCDKVAGKMEGIAVK